MANPFVEPFMTAPSPGIVALACRNEHYDTLDAYLAALGRALQVEYEAIVKHPNRTDASPGWTRPRGDASLVPESRRRTNLRSRPTFASDLR
jgi:hypothetical protein